MDGQLFLLVNLGLGTLFLWWFLRDRRGSSVTPIKLNFSLPETKAKSTPPAPWDSKTKPSFSNEKDIKSEKFESKVNSKPRGPEAEKNVHSKVIKQDSRPFEKKLNVLFMYNGHDWDAYQVLGLPAGCSLELVTEQYQQLIRGADSAKIEFYECAYLAILGKK